MTPNDKDILFLFGKMMLRVLRVPVSGGEDAAVRACVRRLEMEQDRVKDEARAEIAMRFSGSRR